MPSTDYPQSTERTRNIEAYLHEVISVDPGSIKAAVANEALDYSNPKSFFIDILQHGCKSGAVSSLIYYTDTHAFFDKYYDAIEQIRDDVESNLGEPLQVSGDLKNHLAWFAFEETAYRLALELELL